MRKVLIALGAVVGVVLLAVLVLFLVGGRLQHTEAFAIIERSPDQVFPYIVEKEKIREWISGLMAPRLPGDSLVTAGSSTVETFVVNGQPLTAKVNVALVAPNSLVAGTIRLMKDARAQQEAGITIDFRIELDEIEQGTQVYVALDTRFRGVALRVTGPMLSSSWGGWLESRLTALKEIVNEETAPAEIDSTMYDEGDEEMYNDEETLPESEVKQYHDEESMLKQETTEAE